MQDTNTPQTDSDVKFLTASDLEYLTGRNFRTIKKRLGDLEPVKTRGRSKFYEARAAIARVFSSNDAQVQYDLNKERARLAAMQADEKQIDYLRKVETLLPADLVEKEWSNLVGAVRAKLLSIPVKAAPHLLELTTPEEAEHNLRPFILEALAELSNGQTDSTYASTAS